MPIISGSSGSGITSGHQWGYDQITANVNIASTSQAAPTTIITCAAHSFDGAPVMVEFYTSQLGLPTGAVSNTLGIDLWEGATDIAILAWERSDQTANQDYRTVFAAMQFTPTAGSHSYLIRAYAASTTGTPVVVAGSGTGGNNAPAYVRFTKV